ncbi:MAG: hypothetical protein WCG94_07965 [Methanothrix sp.]
MRKMLSDPSICKKLGDSLVLQHLAGDYGQYGHGLSGFGDLGISRYPNEDWFIGLDFPENEKRT